MANYLEIRNENDSVIIGDDFPILQPVENRLYTYNSFNQSSFTNKGYFQNFGPYYSQRPNLDPDYTVGWGASPEDFAVIRPYIAGNSNERATAQVHIQKRKIGGVTGTWLSAFTTDTVNVQEVMLSPVRRTEPVEGSALVAYNENQELVFDSALGTAQLLKNLSVQPGLGNGDKTIEVGDFAGYDLDFNRVFYRVFSDLYKSKTQFSNGGAGYRVGWYAWTPKLYMDSNDKMWIHLKYFTPHGYGTYDSDPISDTLSIQIFYLPSIRLY